jgi:hypothetical protein
VRSRRVHLLPSASAARPLLVPMTRRHRLHFG